MSNKIISITSRGGIGVMPTDTIYGLVGQALNKKVVQRIYKVRKRSPDKPLIILISSIRDLNFFDIKVSPVEKKVLEKFWPGKVSIILPCKSAKWRYLHRGTKSLAFRLPKRKNLIEILKKTGPLVAPSANPEGQAPAMTINEAKNYFGEGVDFYYGRRRLEAPPSALIRINNGEVEVLRRGSLGEKK